MRPFIIAACILAVSTPVLADLSPVSAYETDCGY